MKWYRLVPVLFLGVLLLGSLMVPPPSAFAQASNTLQDNVPGSFLVFPIFDVFSGNQTKIRVTCNGVTGTTVKFIFICQPTGTSSSGLFCPSFDEIYPCTPHQTLVLDVGTEAAGNCPTGQGFVVAFAEGVCAPGSPGFVPGPTTGTGSCTTQTGGTIAEGNHAPISYNQLFGSYHLYYNGFEPTTTFPNPPSSQQCGVPGAPCSPLAAGPFPDTEAENAIAIQSQQPAFTFLGNESSIGLVQTFGPTTAFDYVALPRTLQQEFAAPGAALIAGPPGIVPTDTTSGVELETNIVLLNLNYTQFAVIPPAAMSVNIWNWFEVGFTSTHRFICWERVPINFIDTRITAAGPFAANYGTIRLTPSPAAGASAPQLLGAIEEVTTVGRTIRNMIHSSTAASPATFITDFER